MVKTNDVMYLYRDAANRLITIFVLMLYITDFVVL
jgi:hypothetical protein